MQAALPDVVRAHQQGIGRSAYKRAKRKQSRDPNIIRVDNKYELHRVWDLSGRIYRRIWTAWYIGSGKPFRIYDVQGSTEPKEVLDDLMAWVAGA